MRKVGAKFHVCYTLHFRLESIGHVVQHKHIAEYIFVMIIKFSLQISVYIWQVLEEAKTTDIAGH